LEYDGIVAVRVDRAGRELMIIVLQVAGFAAVLIGLVTIGVGIPVKEFSFGNTLILAGTLGLCTGVLLLGLSVVALELRVVARRLGSGRPVEDSRSRPAPASAGMNTDHRDGAFDETPPMPVQVEVPKVPPVPDLQATPAPLPKQRRNLLFQSTIRRDRERAETGSAESAPSSESEAGEAPSAGFEDAWPKPDRVRGSEIPSQRRANRSSARSADAGLAGPPPPAHTEEKPAVTVLKSGVVDGMAYSLYSDGSIEAQMPEGTMRFASIDELRAHLDQRP